MADRITLHEQNGDRRGFVAAPRFSAKAKVSRRTRAAENSYGSSFMGVGARFSTAGKVPFACTTQAAQPNPAYARAANCSAISALPENSGTAPALSGGTNAQRIPALARSNTTGNNPKTQGRLPCEPMRSLRPLARARRYLIMRWTCPQFHGVCRGRCSTSMRWLPFFISRSKFCGGSAARVRARAGEN